MEKEYYKEIDLSRIRPNPLNPRKRFEGDSFDELVESVRNKGVIQPILIRPVESPEEDFEIVFGERRYRAVLQVSGDNGARIPALIKEMDDDTAFDLMTIENLQREDLTPLEEANSFKIFVDRHGHGGITELAKRINVNERYIRRRLSVLELPDKMLKAWDQDKVKFTHLEQISRIPGKRDRNDLFKEAAERELTTKEIRRHIESNSPVLDTAKFDRKKAGCNTCEFNSDVQAETHGHKTDSKKAVCLNLNCFKKKQNNHFLKNWKKTGYYKQHKTNGFRFFKDVGWGNFNYFWYGDPSEKCHQCDKFITLLDLDGTAREARACLGESKCVSEQSRKATRKNNEAKKKKKVDPNEPRVHWHGGHFRDEFYKERIPERLNEIKYESGIKSNATIDRLSLLTLVKQSRAIHNWFAKRHGLNENDHIDYEWYSLDSEEILNVVKDMTTDQVRDEMHAVISKIIVSSEYFPNIRWLVGDHIGIDLASEWSITDEYLQKKTKAEMMIIGENFKIFEDPKVKSFMSKKFQCGHQKHLKKGELIKLFIESGVELKGKTPFEIANF